MTKDEALRLAWDALEDIGDEWGFTSERTVPKRKEAITAIKEALAQPEQEPVAWNVIDPTGKIVATEMNSVRGWARIEGYKPTVEGLLGFHEQGWRVVPTTSLQRTWIELTLDERIELAQDVDWAAGAYCEYAEKIEAKLEQKNK